MTTDTDLRWHYDPEEERLKKLRRRRQILAGRTTLPFGLAAIKTDTNFLTGVQDGRGRYISQLADYPDDPKAYFTSRDDIKRVCAERGYSCEGAVEVNARPDSTPTWWDEREYEVADDIVEKKVDQVLAGERVGKQERADLKEKTKKTLSGLD